LRSENPIIQWQNQNLIAAVPLLFLSGNFLLFFLFEWSFISSDEQIFEDIYAYELVSVFLFVLFVPLVKAVPASLKDFHPAQLIALLPVGVALFMVYNFNGYTGIILVISLVGSTFIGGFMTRDKQARISGTLVRWITALVIFWIGVTGMGIAMNLFGQSNDEGMLVAGFIQFGLLGLLEMGGLYRHAGNMNFA
jgi:hypothetical protein